MAYRARFLAEAGWKVIVLTPGPEFFVESIAESITMHYLPPVIGRADTLDYTNQRGPEAIKPLRGFLRWLPALLRELRKVIRPGDILYTYNNPICLHLAGIVLRQQLHAWIAEFRDPIKNYEYSLRGVWGAVTDGWLQNRVLSDADIVCMRDGIQVRAAAFEGSSARIETLPDYGVDLSEFDLGEPPPINGVLRGIFAGSLYGGSSLASLDIAASRLSDRLNCQVKLFSKSSDSKNELKNIHHGGYLPFRELISHYRDAHFSVLLDESEQSASLESGFIPSKLAELLALRRPILCIGNPRSRAAQFIKGVEAGVSVVNEAAAIESALMAIADGLAGNRFARDLPERLEKQIDIRHSERAFQALLESLLP